VARTYAGILGPLALVTSLARGSIHATDPQTMLFGAWCSLLMFAAAGWVIGWIAGRVVQESVGATIRAELAQEQTGEASETVTSAA
jgi:hypothetical protein